MTDRLVTTEWVAGRLGDPGVRLVEVDVDVAAWDEGHIEGAVAWNWTTELQDPVRRDIISKENIEKLLSGSGIGNDTHVILYGDNSNWFAAYALWVLELYGHERTALMDGGRVKWAAEGRPLTAEEPAPAPRTYVARDPDPALRATREEVLAAVRGERAAQLVDVRSPDEFSGRIIAPPGMSETAQRGGHVPGALSVPWARAVNEDGTFKSADELRDIYGGVREGSPVITYCRIGERAAHTWFVLKYLLGHEDVKNYDGSWTEYGSLIDAPIEV